MAPSTAFLFVLIGLYLFRSLRSLPETPTPLLKASIFSTLLLTGLLGIAAGIFKSPLLFDRWIFGELTTERLHVGYMSPLTAVLFLLLGVADLVGGKEKTQRWRLAALSLSCSGVVVLVGGVIVSGYLVDMPFMYGGDYVPMALGTAMCFMLASVSQILLRLMVLSQKVESSGNIQITARESTREGIYLLVTLLVFALFVVFLGWYHLSQHQVEFRKQVFNDLRAVGELKSRQISSWVNERLGDAGVFSSEAAFRKNAATFLSDPLAVKSRNELLEWFSLFRHHYHYESVYLFDAQGVLRLTSEEGSSSGQALPSAEKLGLLQKQRAIITDLHFDSDGDSAHLEVVAAVYEPGAEDADNSRLMGYVSLQVNPEIFLYPLIQSWPIYRETAETSLIRQEGSKVVHLNNLRHRESSALKFSLPLDSDTLLDARVLRGESGPMEGLDYRGVAALAVACPVPETDWILIAKIDQAEVYAGLRERTLWTLFMVLFAILSAISSVWLLWHKRAMSFSRREEKLQQDRSELGARLSLLSEQASDAIMLLDGDLNIVEANPSATRIYGYAPEEILKINAMDLRESSDGALVSEQLQLLRASGGKTYESINRRKDGTLFPVEASVSIVGTDAHYLAIVRDISARKTVEEQLKLTAQVLRLLNEARDRKQAFGQILELVQKFGGYSAVAIRLKEDEDFPYFVTRGFAEEFVEAERYLCSRDWKEELARDSTGNPILECMCGNVLCERFNPEQPFFTAGGSFWANSTSRLLATTSEADRLTRTRNRCNSEGYESVALIPLRASGQTVGLLQLNDLRQNRFTLEMIEFFEGLAVSIGFVVERLRTEVALQKSESGLRRAQQAARLGSWEIEVSYSTTNGVVEDHTWSEGLYSILGLDASSNSPSQELFLSKVHQDDRLAIEASLMRPAVEGKRNIRDFRIVRFDGDVAWIRPGMETVLDKEDRIVRIVGIFQDITDYRRLEQQLQQSQKLETIGQLSGGIAHDFNNLLTVINGYTELLLKELPSEGQARRYVTDIRKSGERAEALTRQLLMVSRRQVIEPVNLNLNALVRDTADMLGRLTGERILVSYETAPELGRIMADPTQIQQVLMNLAVNSRDAMPGGGRLTIRTLNATVNHEAGQAPEAVPCGDYVVLSVGDTGCGIADDIRSRIFEPFFTTKPEGKGTGLGLAVVQGVVKQMGGFIEVGSFSGKGTIFDIYLPMVALAETEDERVKPEAIREVLTGNETVLVVEDQPAVRQLLTDVLTGYRYRILTAANGNEALLLCQRHTGPIDLMVTDVMMPEMTGYELAVHAASFRPEMKVLFVSGYTGDLATQEGGCGAIVEYLAKPFSPDDLARRVRKVLDVVRSGASILVVDDEDSVRTYLHQVLSTTGYRVVLARSGVEALQQLDRESVDLVITDIVMPDGEGLELLRRLRENGGLIKVIALSGAFEGKFLKTAELLGAHITMKKPVSSAELLRNVRSLLGEDASLDGVSGEVSDGSPAVS